MNEPTPPPSSSGEGDAPVDPLEMHKARSIAGLLLLIVPIVSIVTVGIAYLVLFSYGAEGQPASGERVAMRYAACPEAEPLIVARVEKMGLGEAEVRAEADGLTVIATLPAEERVAQAIPATLARTGTMAVRPEDDPDAEPFVTDAHIEYATVVLPFLDIPYAHVQLDADGAEALRSWMETHPEGATAVWVDGEVVSKRKNMPPEAEGQLSLQLMGEVTDLQRLDFAAETGLILDHGPLPCPVTLQEVTPVGGAAGAEAP